MKPTLALTLIAVAWSLVQPGLSHAEPWRQRYGSDWEHALQEVHQTLVTEASGELRREMLEQIDQFERLGAIMRSNELEPAERDQRAADLAAIQADLVALQESVDSLPAALDARLQDFAARYLRPASGSGKGDLLSADQIRAHLDRLVRVIQAKVVAHQARSPEVLVWGGSARVRQALADALMLVLFLKPPSELSPTPAQLPQRPTLMVRALTRLRRNADGAAIAVRIGTVVVGALGATLASVTGSTQFPTGKVAGFTLLSLPAVIALTEVARGFLRSAWLERRLCAESESRCDTALSSHLHLQASLLSEFELKLAAALGGERDAARHLRALLGDADYDSLGSPTRLFQAGQAEAYCRALLRTEEPRDPVRLGVWRAPRALLR